ncbi:hypothetical protein TROPICALSUN_69 [Erwinia phage vB_EamM_TropicalSun]|uniref:Uncharacterized protein n=2 Tax=Myosmarvirus myosmar TaxID=2846183 RepID=A0A5B9NJQ9_9CAUD|nr:hypothetical protein HWC56_gp026 [Serratia phage MyoSmar]QEG09475.1 hypothetical protein CPT_MyoSmar_026 [Serratia phage MyoSmar]QEG13859.1 hypothetical protein TROPICALSUN_69 [Erwinia phage vB_EamM_TropicalSun]
MPTNQKPKGKFTIPITIHKLRPGGKSYNTSARETANYVISADGIRFHKRNHLQVGDWPSAQFEYRNVNEQQRVD